MRSALIIISLLLFSHSGHAADTVKLVKRCQNDLTNMSDNYVKVAKRHFSGVPEFMELTNTGDMKKFYRWLNRGNRMNLLTPATNLHGDFNRSRTRAKLAKLAKACTKSCNKLKSNSKHAKKLKRSCEGVQELQKKAMEFAGISIWWPLNIEPALVKIGNVMSKHGGAKGFVATAKNFGDALIRSLEKNNAQPSAEVAEAAQKVDNAEIARPANIPPPQRRPKQSVSQVLPKVAPALTDGPAIINTTGKKKPSVEIKKVEKQVKKKSAVAKRKSKKRKRTARKKRAKSFRAGGITLYLGANEEPNETVEVSEQEPQVIESVESAETISASEL